MEAVPLPTFAVKKATDLVRDARFADLAGLIPLLALLFVVRLAQWYELRWRFPQLAVADAGEHARLAEEFRGALPRLWLAVLLWPGVALFCIVLPRIV